MQSVSAKVATTASNASQIFLVFMIEVFM